MTRPAKPNPTPKAPFNLRVTGPMSPTDIYKKLGKGFRVAHSHGDARATVDADPCPHCGALVEWCPTTHGRNGKVESYVYARCQGKARHSWGLSSREVKDAKDVKETKEYKVKAPKPTYVPEVLEGVRATSAWIDQKIAELKSQIKALEETKRLMQSVDHQAPGQRPPDPRPSN